MKTILYPTKFFNSLAEYNGYCRCLYKIAPGDMVDYFVSGYNNPSSLVSNNTQQAIVLGIKKSGKEIMLGAKTDHFGFWQRNSFNNVNMYDYIKVLKNHQDYPFGWMVKLPQLDTINNVPDLRISKIEKAIIE
jgi:hypothetical protein